MRKRLVIAGVGNVIDTLSTLYLFRLGGLEVNPVMSFLLRWPLAFSAVKLSLMGALLCWLWRHRTDRHARPLATIAAAVYGCIAVYYTIVFVVVI